MSIKKPKSLKECLSNASKIYSKFPKWKKEAFKIDTYNLENTELQMGRSNKMKDYAEIFFEYDQAEGEFTGRLADLGVTFDSLSWDKYDSSLELRGVPNDCRLESDASNFIFNSGFIKIYLYHHNNWQTHYSSEAGYKPFRKRHVDNCIEVEELPESWPLSWLTSGYVKVVGKK